MWTVDGEYGEGGGQILRSALALSAATQTPVRIEKIRAGRKKPGLMRQHLTAVQAAARTCGAYVEGASLGSQEVVFEPGEIHGGVYEFAVGTAGSAMLVLQTILMPLLLAEEPSSVRITGGTHARNAPPFDFTEESLAPALRSMGAEVGLTLKKYGFFPAGGGEVEVEIKPPEQFEPLELMARGEWNEREIRVITAHLPNHVADRELMTAAEELQWPLQTGKILRTHNAHCAGNAVMIRLSFEHHQEVLTSFGARGLPAEQVAARVVEETRQYLESDAVVGEHLADQLLLPMALGAGGRFLTGPLSKHSETQIWLIPQVLDVEFTVRPVDADKELWEVVVEPG